MKSYKVYKAPRWVILIVLLTVLGLLCLRPDPISRPQAPASLAENARSFQTKLGGLLEAHQQGQAGQETRLTSEEVEASLIEANRPQESPAGAPDPSLATDSRNSSEHANLEVAKDNPVGAAALMPEKSAVKDPQVIFEGDEVKGQFAANVYGKDIFVTFSARLGAKEGYVTVSPTSFKIGNLPIPLSLVKAQLENKLNDPATHEQLKLPEFVSALRLENGQLVVTEK